MKAEIRVERLMLAFVRNFDLRSWLVLIVLPLVFGLASSNAPAQNSGQSTAGTHGRKSIRAERAESPLVLDGNLDEPAWQQAPISREFVQKDPREGEPATERTEFRVVYTATMLYIGVICYDSNAGGIVAAERRRDSELENDDRLSLVLDTFHDHRNAFLFRTNPLGTQYDALITDEGNSLNANWDEQWNVVSRITPEGWTAEFAIPFKSLRISEQNGQGWGVDLERVIRRKNEFSHWNGYRRGFQIQHVSQAGHLEGVENIESGLRLRVKPFVVGG
ncbi:MAG: carbohydrate binding family 9 domain-containing protein, partial [Terriglobia bacterium]